MTLRAISGIGDPRHFDAESGQGAVHPQRATMIMYQKLIRGRGGLVVKLKRLPQYEFHKRLSDTDWNFIDNFVAAGVEYCLFILDDWSGIALTRYTGSQFEQDKFRYLHFSGCLHDYRPVESSIIKTRNGPEATKAVCANCDHTRRII